MYFCVSLMYFCVSLIYFCVSPPRVLTLTRQPAGGPSTLLASYDLTHRDNGLVDLAWNMVRVVVVRPQPSSASLRVWVNPAAPDTGLVGDPSVDMGAVFSAPPPLLQVADRYMWLCA